jgi:putative flippase GtrA
MAKLASATVVQFVRFSAVGAVNTIVGLMVICGLLYFARANPVVANAGGYLAGFTVSYLLNSKWSFRSSAPGRLTLPRFVLVTLVAYLCNLLLLAILLRLPGADPYLSQALSIAVSTLVSFLGCRWLVFRRGGNGAAFGGRSE